MSAAKLVADRPDPAVPAEAREQLRAVIDSYEQAITKLNTDGQSG